MLAVGTALSGIGYLIAGASVGFWTLVIALLIGGLGSSTQHPLASALVARAFAGPRSMKALGTYNFAGDIGKMSVPAAASLLLVLLPWQPVLAILGLAGLASRRPRSSGWRRGCRPKSGCAKTRRSGDATAGGGSRFGFPVLLSIGMIDSATRMGFLIFLPFVLIAKGASLPTVGLALTLVFAGGAAGKLVCAFIGARIGVIATVCLTEGLTTRGHPRAAAAAARSRAGGAAGHRHHAQRHLVGALRLGAGTGRAGEAHAHVRHLLHRHDRLRRGRRPRSTAWSATRSACRPR